MSQKLLKHMKQKHGPGLKEM